MYKLRGSLFVTILGAALAVSGCSGDDDGKKPVNKDTDVDTETDPNPNPGETFSAGMQLTTTSADVRACDLLLTEPAGKKVDAIEFSDKVKGQFMRRSPKVAVSFFAVADGALDSTIASVTGDLQGLTLDSINCFDRSGAPVTDPLVAMQYVAQ